MSDNPNIIKKLNNATPSQVDMKLSWYLFRKNIRPYASITIFTIFATVVVILSLTFAIVIPSVLIDKTLVENEVYINIVTAIIVIPMISILYAFFGSGYGLAFDIMTSGDEFARFKGAFQYFKKYWWQYTIISIICVLPTFVLNPWVLPLSCISSLWFKIPIHVIFYLFSYIIYAIFGMALPAITAHGNFKQSLKESIQLFKDNKMRYFKTWGIFLLLFYLPNLVVLEINFLQMAEVIEGGLVYQIILFTGFIYSMFIESPMQALVSTRLYNSLQNAEISNEIEK